MAEKANHFSFRPDHKRRSSIYPWDEWLDGNVWKLIPGQDFPCATGSFVAQVHGKAKERGLRAQTSVQGEFLYIQAYKSEVAE